MVPTGQSLRGLLAAIFVVLGLGLIGLSNASYADPGTCTGNCYAHDPAMIKRADGTYFRFNTGGGIQIYKASSIEGSWTYEGDALPSGSSINLDGNTDLWVSLNSSFLHCSVPVCLVCGMCALGKIRISPLTKSLQAPFVILIDSTYYLYYAVSTFGSQNSAIGYATSTTMEYGSWTDHGSTGIASSSSKAYNAIDPTIVESASGAYCKSRDILDYI